MRYLSLFSGIEAASAAWLPLGWECVAVSEIDQFPCAVLSHYYPHVPNLGDVTKITRARICELGPVDIVVGGFPCQDVSVAGKKAGLKNDDGSATRSGLFFDAVRIADWARARWTVIENVPGLFSNRRGRDFAAVVGALSGCEFDVPQDGWRNAGVAVGPKGLVEWTTLDAQYHGLAQRRRRVFIVRDSGNWADRPPLFLEPYRLQGNSPPSRESGEDAPAGTIGCSHGNIRADEAWTNRLIAKTVTTREGRRHDESAETLITHALRGEGFDASEDGTGRGTPLIAVATTLSAGNNANSNAAGRRREDDSNLVAQTITAEMYRSGGATAGSNPGVRNCFPMQSGVRRLTPRECERLMGFPDDYTLIPYNGKPAKDSPRYKAIGNSFAVPIIKWIGSRIQAVDDILNKRSAA